MWRLGGKRLLQLGTAPVVSAVVALELQVAAQCRGMSMATTPISELTQPVKLYQYNVCPFCNKVQAFLEYHRIPYEKVEVNPLTKKEIEFSDYKMVPFAILDGEQVNGSSEIIRSLVGATELGADERRWVEWVDDHLIHVLPPNIYRTPKEAIEAFDYISNNSNFSYIQGLSARYVGAVVMYFIAKRAKAKYNLSDDPRQDLYDAVALWTSEGLGTFKFHGGNQEPDIADLNVYGVLRAIEGDNYETWNDLRSHEFDGRERFFAWYDRMARRVKGGP